MKFSLFSAVLFSIGWMSFVAAGDGRAPSCCLEVKKTRIPVINIKDYEIQESTGVCGIKAVRFHTKKDKHICSDPNDDWAIKAIQYVNKILKIEGSSEEPSMCYTSTTNMIPTVTTTNKTPETETETSTSTTASRIVTTIETSRPETETSTSTTASRIVTTIETSRPETEITKTTNQPTSVSKENPESSLSTVTTCGTGGQSSPSTETRRGTPGIGTITNTDNTGTTSRVITTTSPRTKKLSKLIIRKRGKSKNRLRTFQNGIRDKNKPGKNNNHTQQ